MHMHIFEGARHLSNSEWVIRAIIAYIFLILVAKAMGQSPSHNFAFRCCIGVIAWREYF